MEYRTSHGDETLTVIDNDNKLTIHSSAVTNVGMVRGNNEDSVQIWAFKNFVLALVADGMGGAAGGEQASALAVDAVQADFIESKRDSQIWRNITENEIEDKMRFALAQANQAVLDRAAEDHHLQGMGTTATMVLLHHKRAIFAHIGDSRAYHVYGDTGEIRQITDDHSFVEALVTSGHLTKEQAAEHPMRNVLYKALGQKPESDLEIDIYTDDLSPGDWLVLCSDGLPRHLSDKEIGEITLSSKDTLSVAQNLIKLANDRGGEDNVSAIVLHLAKS
jgi:protein phosphatase